MKNYIHHHTNFDEVVQYQEGEPSFPSPRKVKNNTFNERASSIMSRRNLERNEESRQEEEKQSIPEEIYSEPSISSKTKQRVETYFEENIDISRRKSKKYKRSAKSCEKFEKKQPDIFLSTQNLRKKNKKLIRQIQYLRSIEPQVRKNSILIHSQKNELSKINKMCKMALGINYQLSIDTEKEKLISERKNLRTIITEKQAKLRVRNLTKKFNIKSKPAKEECLEDFSVVHEQYLCKRKEEQIHKVRLQQLDKKIEFYRQKISGLEHRQRLLSYGDLQNRIMFLKYDIEYHRGRHQQRETFIIQQISSLNNEVSALQLKIIRSNQQLSCHRKKFVEDKPTTNTHLHNQSQSLSKAHTMEQQEKKQPRKLSETGKGEKKFILFRKKN